MQTFSELIEAYTETAVATALGVPESHVRTMKARNSIAPDYWPVLIAGAPDALKPALSFETLAAMRARRFSKVPA